MKNKFVPKLIFALLPVFFSASIYAQQESEPNNNARSSDNANLNGVALGQVAYVSDDWWQIHIPSSGRLDFYLNSVNGGNETVGAIMYDHDGSTQLINNFTAKQGSTGTAGIDSLAAGVYYIKIFNADPDWEPQFNYSLQNVFTPAVTDDDQEPNDSRHSALTLPVNSLMTGSVGYYYYNQSRDTADWYKIATTDDGLLHLKLTPANGSRTEAILFDHDGVTQLGNIDANSTTGYLNADGLAAGAYYVRIQQYDANTFALYTLSDSLYLPAQANDNEPNDEKDSAKTLNVNAKTTGHVGYYYDNYRDTADWYVIKIAADGELKFTLTAANNGSRTTLDFFDKNGITKLGSVNTSKTDYLNVDGLAKGIYYVRVYENHPNAFATYTLKDSLKKYQYTADDEPNDAPYQADNIVHSQTVTGHINFYYNHSRDLNDWFKFHYTGNDGNVYFTIKLLPELNDNVIHRIYFDVYKDTSSSPISSKIISQATNSIQLSSLAKRNYYIRIHGFKETYDWSAYAIKFSLSALPNFTLEGNNELNSLAWNVTNTPGNNNYAVQLQLTKNANVAIQVFSLNGNLVQNIDKENMQKGNYNIPFNLYNALPGMYIVNLMVDDKLYAKKIMK